MSWMLSIWVAAALLALCRGQSPEHEGNSLSLSGYHLCTRYETRTVSVLVMHKVPHTVTKPCGGWILRKSCTVTLYTMTPQTEYKTVMEQVTGCCSDYEQVGGYCALPVNRSGEFAAKLGHCPTADGSYPGSMDCVWDTDCPGWQKCCNSLCCNPASPVYDSGKGGLRLNATVTVKADYEHLMSTHGGLLNHTRLLQAMVTGALESNVSVYYLSSWPVHPYRTATSLLVNCSSALSMQAATAKLHLLLKHIQEVSSVTVEDVDECAQPVLRQCSPHADCNNTVGSYFCSCRQGYIDVDPGNPGAHCIACINVTATVEPPVSYLPPMNTTFTQAPSTTQDPQDDSTPDTFSSTESSMTTALSNTSSVLYNTSHAQQWTSAAPHTTIGSTVEIPLPTTTCSPPSISSLWSANVTGTSFCIYWSTVRHTNQTYQVVLSQGSEVVLSTETNQTMEKVEGLQPGVLYHVSVTPRACGGQGVALRLSVKTDAQTLDATARLTNIKFNDDLQNSSSQAYQNLTNIVMEEIYQSLSPEIMALVESGQVTIKINSFSPGSVFVNFTIIFTPSQNQDISNVSNALLHSLMNSSKFTVDKNSSNIYDFDECASLENDCSQWGSCINSWGSYTCVCMDGFIDNSPERPGRACQANVTVETVTPHLTTTTDITTPQLTITDLAAITVTPSLGTVVMITSDMLSTPAPAVTTAQATTTVTFATTTVATKSTTPSTTTSIATTTSPTLTTTTTHVLMTTTTPALTTTTTPRTTITSAVTTTSSTPTTTIPSSTATTTPALVTTTATTPPTTSSALTTTTPTQTTITPSLMITTRPPTTTTSPLKMTTAAALTTTIPLPATTTIAFTTTTHALTTTTPTSPATTSTTPTTTPTKPSTTTSAITSTTPTTVDPTTNTTVLSVAPNALTLGAISVQCRVAAITATVARDFLQNNNIMEAALYLGLPDCGVNGGNGTHVQLTVAWNECVTRLVHNETNYVASVTLFNNMDPYTSPNGTVQVPKIRLEVPIMCAYMKSMLISADFGSMGYDLIKDIIMGSGSFQVTVQLMNGTMPLPHNYSLSREEVVVVEVSLNTSSEQIKLVVNRCWATPTSNPADTASYTFLENSCSLNTFTKVLMNGNSSTSRLSVQIFSFVNLNVIYLHCQVQICVEVGSESCVPDCLQRKARSANTVGSGFASFGPVLRSDDDSLEDEYNYVYIIGFSCLGVGLSLFFIIGFICLFYYQRNRIGHYNFSVKPKQDNFTYLVFNA